MIKTSWDNHYKLGYDGRWFEDRTSPLDKFEIQVDGCGRKPLGLNFEAINTARILNEFYGNKHLSLIHI